MKTKYMYKVLKNVDGSQITEANLNAQGQLGWKLITLQKGSDAKYDAIFIKE